MKRTTAQSETFSCSCFDRHALLQRHSTLESNADRDFVVLGIPLVHRLPASVSMQRGGITQHSLLLEMIIDDPEWRHARRKEYE